MTLIKRLMRQSKLEFTTAQRSKLTDQAAIASPNPLVQAGLTGQLNVGV
jgi:hypothetical protein